MLAAGAYVAQVIAGADLPFWQIIALTIFGGLATAAVIVLAAVQTAGEARKRREAEAASADAAALASQAVQGFQEALNDIFLPFSGILARAVTVSSADRPALQAEAKRAVVNYVARFINANRARACYFELVDLNGSQRLECQDVYDGRSGAPKTVFRRGNPFHERVFQQLEERKTEFWPNLDQNGPSGFPATRTYKTYISAPVATQEKVYGLLTVDALEPGELTEDHEPFVRLFAQLLAVALKGNKQRRN